MSDALSDPLLCAALLLALAGVILVLGLALQASANASRRRSSWQEMADGHRVDESPEVAQAPVAQAPQAPVPQAPVPQAPAAQAPVAKPDARIEEPEGELITGSDTSIERIDAGSAPAQEPIVPAQEPVTNDRPPEDRRRVEELAGANGSDGGWTRIETPRDVAGENGLLHKDRKDRRENGVQDKDRDRRWMEDLIARADAIEESCGRADEASARVTRLLVPPHRSDN